MAAAVNAPKNNRRLHNFYRISNFWDYFLFIKPLYPRSRVPVSVMRSLSLQSLFILHSLVLYFGAPAGCLASLSTYRIADSGFGQFN